MGGLIGMMLAAEPHNPIRSLILNDIGPFIPEASLRRISEYVHETGPFNDLNAVENRLRKEFSSNLVFGY